MASTAEPVAASPFERIGGHETILAISNRFYDLMESDPAYAELRAMHAPDLTWMRVELARFLAGWCGGPRDWFTDNPGKCMMSLHKSFTISHDAAGQWAEAMTRAIADVGPADRQIAEALGSVLSDFSLGMGR